MELWDNDSIPAGTPEKIELDSEGFRIQWEGDEGDPSLSMLSSSCNFTMHMTPAQRADFIAAAWGDAEYNVMVRLYRTNDLDNESLFWAGVVLPETVKERIEDGYVQIDVNAVDGLSLLKEINFVDDSLNRYSGEKDAIEWIYECLKKVPTHNYMFSNLALDMFLEERMIMRPITDAYPAFANTDAVLDTLQMHSNSLYQIRVEEARERKGFEQRKAPKNSAFFSTYEVLHNIVASLGATLCLGDGRWQLFDRERVINLADNSTNSYFSWYLDGTWQHTPITYQSEIDFDADGKNLLVGATRTALYPIAAAMQSHKGAGSDLIWRAGDGWIQSRPGGGSRRPQITQYTGASSLGFNNVHLWRAIRGVNSPDEAGRTVVMVGAGPPPYTLQKVGSLDGDMLNNPADGLVEGLLLPIGDNGGEITVNFGGNATFRGSGSTVNENLPLGTTGLYRQYLEVSDGTNSFRFRRRMRTYPYNTSGTPFSVDIASSGSANNYVPRFYEEGFWVRDDDDRYPTAYLDVMIGCDPTVLDSGTSDLFLQSDFTQTSFYTPPRLKASPDTDNVLIQALDDDRTHFQWRFSANIAMPTVLEGASAELTSMKIWNPRYVEIQAASDYAAWRDSSGTPIDVQLTEALDNAEIDSQLAAAVNTSGGGGYRTATESGLNANPAEGYWNLTEVIELSGIDIFVGDGTAEWDIDNYANMDSPSGSEFMQLESTALGATYVNSGNRTFGRWLATHPLGGGQEDNLQFVRYNDPSTTFSSMGRLVADNALQVRGDIRQIINGTVICNGADYGKEVLTPWRAFTTSKFGGGSEEWYVPMRVSFTGEGRQQLTAIKSSTWTAKPTTNSDHESGFSGDVGVNTGTGPHSPGGLTVRAFNKTLEIEDITEHFDATGMTGSIPITEIQDKINKVQTTNPITDSDLGGGGNTAGSDLLQIFLER